MTPAPNLDRLLVTLDVAIQNLGICEVAKGRSLLGVKVPGVMVHYVLKGTMYLTLPGMDTLMCREGSVVLVPAGLEPRMAADFEPACEVAAIDHASMTREGLVVFDAANGRPGDLRFVCGVIGATVSGSLGLFDKMKVPLVEDMSDVELVRFAYETLLHEISRPGLGARAMTAALMKTCILMVIRRFFARPGGHEALLGGLSNPRLGAVVAAVLNEPGAPHTIASLAATSGMSRSTMVRLFSEAFGTTPMEFVAKARLHHAADLLRSGPLPIKTIAAMVGHSSRSHFSRAFRDAYGVDPRTFRRQWSEPALDAPQPFIGPLSRLQP